MAVERKRLATWLGFGLIVLFMGGLALLPERLRQKNYRVSTPNEVQVPSKFPMERKLRRLAVDPRRKVTVGEEVSLAALAQDRTLLVNFWATWCPPCIEELPSLEFLARQTQSGKQPLVVAISVDDNVGEIQTLVQNLDYVPTFVILHDPGGTVSSAVGTTKFPETYWVKEDSTILYKWAGPQDWLSRDVLTRLSLSFGR